MKSNYLIIVFFVFNGLLYSQDTSAIKKLLIVATNVDHIGLAENGTFLPEIAYPFKRFIELGYTIDIVTPRGGLVAIFPGEFAAGDLGKIQRSSYSKRKQKNHCRLCKWK